MSGTTFDRRELIIGAGALAIVASLPVAVVKLPFRLRSGTHVNWFSADDLAAQRAESV